MFRVCAVQCSEVFHKSKYFNCSYHISINVLVNNDVWYKFWGQNIETNTLHFVSCNIIKA